MKQYCWIRLYQVSPSKGYLKNNEIYSIFYFLPTLRDDIVPELEHSIESKKIIMVEKISPYQVREVKTGLIFPIVEFKKKPQEDLEYISTNLKKVHTFVCSRENKLISSKVTSSEEIEQYNQSYPDVKKYKEELLAIFEVGESNMENKIEQENQTKKQNKIAALRNKREELLAKKQERRKVRRLQRQFKQGRKNTK